METVIEKFNRRFSIFRGEGLCEDGAYRLASQMQNRDADPQDDRKVCFECNHYRNKVCLKMIDRLGKTIMPLRFILQRCPNFQPRGQK